MTYALIGEQLTRSEVIDIAAPAIAERLDAEHGLTWNLIHLIATLDRESALYSHAINVVEKDDPEHPSHLSIDLGIAQFNSRWFPDLSERLKLDPAHAIPMMVLVAHQTGIANAKPWRLDFRLWNAHDTTSDGYRVALSRARDAVNERRGSRDLAAI